MSKRGARGKGLRYSRPDPPFLQRIRQQVCNREQADINSKLKVLEKDNDADNRELDNEKPTYVLGKNVSDLDAEDYFEGQRKEIKLVFKKPVKDGEKSSTAQAINANQNAKSLQLKRQLNDDENSEDRNKRRSNNSSKQSNSSITESNKPPAAMQQKASLLSFGNDDDDDDADEDD